MSLGIFPLERNKIMSEKIENSATLQEQLREFRTTHPVKNIASQNHRWNYICCGQGDRVLLLLEGAGAAGEVEFQRILKFEKSRRIISVTYPATAVTMQDLVTGIAAILETENVRKAAVHGHSLGGALAQCFLRAHPEMVSESILANIGVASRRRIRLARIFGYVLSVLPSALIGTMVKSALGRNLSALPEPEREFYREYFAEMVKRYLTKELIINQLRCMFDFIDNYHFRVEDLKFWGGRVLILEAEDDRGWNASERAALKELYPQANVHTFNQGGHLVGMTKRAEYDEVLSNFLD
jgi:pimeloyl-ACP methyl ester carboxylesterase